MNINNRLEALQKIKPVEAPPFLFTRIEARMQAGAEVVAGPRWRLAISTGFLLLLIANMYVVFSSGKPAATNEMATVASAMNLSHSNSFYDE